MVNESNTADDDGEPSQKRAGDRFPAWLSVAGVIVAGLLTAWAAYEGSRVGAQAQLKGQATQLHATLQDETRQKRASVYGNFLNAADSYASATDGLMISFVHCHPCTPDVAGFEKARAAFQGAINDVYVYGSAAAVAASERVAGTLPASLGNYGPVQKLTLIFNQAGFVSSYRSFQAVMCREVPAIPRSSC